MQIILPFSIIIDILTLYVYDGVLGVESHDVYSLFYSLLCDVGVLLCNLGLL